LKRYQELNKLNLQSEERRADKVRPENLMEKTYIDYNINHRTEASKIEELKNNFSRLVSIEPKPTPVKDVSHKNF
jgi:hypothetical protein